MSINISGLNNGFSSQDYITSEAVRRGFEFGLRYWLVDVYVLVLVTLVFVGFCVASVKSRDAWVFKLRDLCLVVLVVLVFRLFVQMLVVG